MPKDAKDPKGVRHSKKYRESAKLIDKTKSYDLGEAIAMAKKSGAAKFDGSLELHLNLGVDPKQSEQQVRSSVTLPHGTGKTIKLTVIAAEEQQAEAKKAGADVVGGQEIIDNIKKTGKADFDILVTTPDMMAKLAAVARVLGPKGLMPSPKNGTITKDLAAAVKELKAGKVNFKNDDTSNLHQTFGKVSFTEKQLEENLETLLTAIKKAKPAGVKGVFIKSATVAATMGPGIRVKV
ncbi:50S ribosomal protein L1 [bacterium]|nr:50S ribosomal protein L1 [bacterium]